MYKPSFVTAYKKSRSKLPIHVWHQVAGRHLPQFQTDEDVYTPVPINVKLSGGINDPNGSVRLSVCPTNKEWYHDLTSALTEMTGKRNIDVVNMEGKCISGFDTKHLFAAGECDIIDKNTKSVIRLESVVEPPLRMATNKGETLKQWWEDQSESISREVAQVLRGKNMSEIASATTKTGEVYKVIQSKLEQSAPNEFLKIYGSGLIRTSAQDLSDKLLHAVRRSLVANEQQIRHYHASNVTPDQSLWKQKETANIQSSYKDDFTLYRDIIDDAIIHPAVSRDVINSVLYGTKKIEGPIVTPSVKEQQFSDYHPLESFYKTYYYNTYGKLPGHVVSAYNKTIGTNMQQKMFPGDADEAFNVFHMLSGRAFDLVGKDEERRKKDNRGLPSRFHVPGEKKGKRPKSYHKKEDPAFWHFKKRAYLHDARQDADESGGNWYFEAKKNILERKYMKKKKTKKPKKTKDNINLVHISELLMENDGEETIASELPRLVPIDQEIFGEDDELVEGALGDWWKKQKIKRQGKKKLKEAERRKREAEKSIDEAKREMETGESQIRVNSELPRLVPIDQEMEDIGEATEKNPLFATQRFPQRFSKDERLSYERFLQAHKYRGFVSNEMIKDAYNAGQMKIYKHLLYLRDHKNAQEEIGSELPRLVPIDSEVIDLEVFGKVFPVDINRADRIRAINLYSKYKNYADDIKEANNEIRDAKQRKHVIQYLKYMQQQKTNVNSKVTSELPRLVPIDSELISGRGTPEKHEKPKPKELTREEKRRREQLKKEDPEGYYAIYGYGEYTGSRLVPIPRDETLNSNLWDDETDELPSISQLLSGKY